MEWRAAYDLPALPNRVAYCVTKGHTYPIVSFKVYQKTRTFARFFRLFTEFTNYPHLKIGLYHTKPPKVRFQG